MALSELVTALAPTIISGLFGMAQSWIGGNSSNVSSATNQSGMSSTTGSTQQTSQTAGQTQTTGSETQTGNIGGIADMLKAALQTPSNNNAQTAADFNAISAATANNLQQNLWNAGNMLSMGSNLLSNAMSAASTTSARQYNSAEAEKQRQWQEHMSSTSYQRGVEDLKKAGLNPILAAYNGYGAGSAPSGGYGSVSGGQNFAQANIASAPSMHTATMQAMYDYGNNTAQFLNNAMTTINNAKQTRQYSEAKMMSQIMESVGSSSAKTIENLSRNLTETSNTTRNAGEWKNPSKTNTSGGTTHGGGAGRSGSSKTNTSGGTTHGNGAGRGR